MSFWGSVKGWFGGSGTRQGEGEQVPFPVASQIKTAKTVTEDSALQVSAVWACARLLAETVASLPLNVYEISGDDREISGGNLQRLLNKRPNSRMTSLEFREAMMLNLVLHGNSYARIERMRGEVVALWPMAATQMRVEIMPDESIVYEYHHSNGVHVYAPESVLHIKLFGNGVSGMSPLAYARSTIGLSIAAEDFASRYYLNGGKPGGVLSIDKILTEEQRQVIRKNFAQLTEGSENAHRLMVLEAGMSYQQVQINPEDMQMLQTRRFQLEDVARFFGVPSFLINDTEKTTTWGSGIEQMMLGFYKLSLRPYLSRWEQALTTTILSNSQQRRMVIEFDFDELLRGDSAGQAEYFSKMTQNGLMTRNEVRRKKNLKPVSGGDDLTVQTNLAPIQKLGVINGD